MSNYKIELDIDQVSELVRNNLIDDYRMMVEQIKHLEFLKMSGPLQSYMEEDLADTIEIRDALRTILKYYMIPSKYNEMFRD
jgi:hypothetical protein